MARGRQKGTVVEKQVGYISVNEDLRIKVDEDCLVLEERKINQETGVESWTNARYYTSWDSVLQSIIRRYTVKAVVRKGEMNLKEARLEILAAIRDVKNDLLGEIEDAMKSSSEEIKNRIAKYNK
jgi:hypothetical protein